MAEETLMRLRMKDGSFAVGYVRPASAANHVGWQMQGFRDPFEFESV
jgi:hypothetical protein